MSKRLVRKPFHNAPCSTFASKLPFHLKGRAPPSRKGFRVQRKRCKFLLKRDKFY